MKHVHSNREQGFTLVELLVVILIIGILAAIAIPAFMEQRKRANDAAVKSDIKNVAAQIETFLISSPNAELVSDIVPGTQSNPQLSGDSYGTVALMLTSRGQRLFSDEFQLSDGVHIDVAGHSNFDPSGNEVGANNYRVTGWHDNGSEYTSRTNSITYWSAEGGFNK